MRQEGYYENDPDMFQLLVFLPGAPLLLPLLMVDLLVGVGYCFIASRTALVVFKGAGLSSEKDFSWN